MIAIPTPVPGPCPADPPSVLVDQHDVAHARHVRQRELGHVPAAVGEHEQERVARRGARRRFPEQADVVQQVAQRVRVLARDAGLGGSAVCLRKPLLQLGGGALDSSLLAHAAIIGCV